MLANKAVVYKTGINWTKDGWSIYPIPGQSKVSMGWIIIKTINSHLSISIHRQILCKESRFERMGISSSQMLEVVSIQSCEPCVEELVCHCGIMNCSGEYTCGEEDLRLV